MIYSKDVMDFLKDIQDETVDLVVADPPYGIDKDYGIENSWTTIESWAEWCDAWLKECNRILKPDGSIIVYGIHNYLCYNQISLYKLGLTYRRQFIWHYENGFCGNRKLPRATYEPFLWFTKGEGFYFTEIREPYKSAERLKYAVRKSGKVWQPHPDGRIAGDVWNIPTLAGRRFKDEKVDHPSQKPLMLSERLINHFSPPDGEVVVPFCGSGSECLAAYRLGRRFKSTEINSHYKEIAEARLAAEGWSPSDRGKGDQGKPKSDAGTKETVAPCASTVNH